jgi:hypothetical protein
MAYVFPLRANELELNEWFVTGVHASKGIQAQAKDIGARRHSIGPYHGPKLQLMKIPPGQHVWDDLKSPDANQNEWTNWVIYDKPFYAMASGTVIGGWRNAPENPGLGKAGWHPAVEDGKMPGGGNILWIEQDDGVIALYAHARPGTIPSDLCPNQAEFFTGKPAPKGAFGPPVEPEASIVGGATVRAGQLLGDVGHTGQSGEPHLHVHMEKGGMPCAWSLSVA